MKNHSKKTGNQQPQHAPGPIYPYFIRRQGAGPPALNRTSSQPFRVLTLLIFNLALLILLFACPGPPEETICGQGMILQNDTCTCIPNAHPSEDGESCECDTLYHWNDDLEECILDTTTYNIDWVFDTLGIYPSWINDVSIISQNDIWAVGKITYPDPDSSWNGTGKESFNAAHWDGDEWSYHHLDAVDAWGNVSAFGEIYSIFSFSENNIWMFTSRGSYIHYDGHEWTTEYVPERRGSIKSIWGSSQDNLYFVGRNGNITHYDGNRFTLIESGTDIHLLSVGGSLDAQYVMCVGIDSDGSIALQLTNGDVRTIFDNSSSNYSETSGYKAVGLWDHIAYIATFHGLLTYDFETGDTTWVNLNDLINNFLYIWKIDVYAPNDIFIAGDGGHMLHYNGQHWTYDASVKTAFSNNGYSANVRNLDVKDNVVVMAGSAFGGEHAFIARGDKQ